ncbi:MAG TPA: hypothetical protein VHF06_34800 [Pseudonocardiaceae bacterium]|nr:hypothetical protein [Pseudonocardiaceae bacterium]
MTDAVDRASRLVRTACEGLTKAIDGLTPLLPDCDGPSAEEAVATYRAARDTLLAQLDTMDRARKAVGA